MDFGYTILVIAVCGAGFLQLLRQMRREWTDFSEIKENLLR